MEYSRRWAWLRSREMLLLVIFIGVIFVNINLSPFFLGVDNLVNVLLLSVEKAMIALIMTYIIISAEIDLSVAAVMGLCATAFGWLYQNGGVPLPLAALITLGIGLVCGAFNGMWIAYLGLPSLAVTLAGLVGYRGLGYVILEEKSVTNFPDWFSNLGRNIPGLPFPPTLLLFVILYILFLVVLHFSSVGRYVYAIGNNKKASHFAGVRVQRYKLIIFIISGLMSALAGLVYAARVGTVRANVGDGFELDIITMVVLGGVSIFGGS